ncbi:MAG: PH domain-containing protein [Candidatus Aenigmatarchaeota archaeon]
MAKKQILIPYFEIQDIQEQQHFLHRLMGIENLIILTLAKERSGLLECLKKEDAKEICEENK